jgi:outer membrane protein assembly factor BamB
VWGTAAVDEERKLLFIGTGNNYAEPSGRYSDSLLAIDYESGELRWYKQFTAGDTYAIYGSQGPDYDIGSSANLFEADGRDLVGIGVKSGEYYALDRESGAVIWMAPLGSGSVLGGVISASAYADGLIFAVCNAFARSSSTAFAIDARNGEIVWRFGLSNMTYGGVAHANGVVYIGTTSGALYALDGASGDMLWTDQAPDGQAIAGGPSVAQGRLLVPWGYQWTLRERRRRQRRAVGLRLVSGVGAGARVQEARDRDGAGQAALRAAAEAERLDRQLVRCRDLLHAARAFAEHGAVGALERQTLLGAPEQRVQAGVPGSEAHRRRAAGEKLAPSGA